MTQQVVIGAGEVGTALATVLDGAHLRDVEHTGPTRADVLHLCIPYTPAFVQQVAAYQTSYKADLVVVHSTVPVGTCDPHGWVHSPVRGRHPDLVDGLKTFVKHFGGRRAGDAAVLFADRGVDTHITERAVTTEAGKLWELVQYGLQIVVQKAVRGHCLARGADPEVAYDLMARTYNDGYQQLGHDEFVRPVLEHMPGPIGGHCVLTGAQLLDHPLGDLVLDASAAAGQEVQP